MRDWRNSRTNRDRRKQSFARSVIAIATKLYSESEGRAALRDIEVCPDCLGAGEVVRHVSDTIVTEAICLECNGKGYVE